MKAKTLMLVALSVCMVLSSCIRDGTVHEAVPYSGEPSLDIWLKDTLIPYLAEQFSRHPRFKGQPVLLVRMQADNVMPNIDDLTDQIRLEIIDALLNHPGIHVAWRPTARPWKHHERPEDISCPDYRKVDYFIGIDCGLTSVERRLYVKVRALNSAEQKWVSGFGLSWQGRPTAVQAAALGREHPDEHLRGLRPLPFSDRQPDLLAAYLARNLSCLLRQSETDDPVVQVQEASANDPHLLRTTLQLTAKYLARFREVEVTGDPARANIVVLGEIHDIDRNLRQIWLSARSRRENIYLPGAETEAYVWMETSESSDGAAIHPKIPTEMNVSPPPSRTLSLISDFYLLTPADPILCATETPWNGGIRRVGSRDHLPSGGCLAVEINLSAAAHVFLVGRDADGGLTTLFPSGCPSLDRIGGFLQPGHTWRFPPPYDARRTVLELDDASGMESVYAIAVKRRDAASQFATRLKRFRGLCRPEQTPGSPEKIARRMARWQDYLARFTNQYPQAVEWREIRFQHDPPPNW